MSLAIGVPPDGVALGSLEGEGVGEGGAGVGVSEGVTPGGTVADGGGVVDDGVGLGGVTEGRTRVQVGGTTITGGTKSGCPIRNV